MITKGIILTAHSANCIEIPLLSRTPTAVAFGGVPMGVPIPPILAARGMARARPVLPFSFSGNVESTGARKVRNTAAVAVSLINIEKVAITQSKPRSTDFGFLPKGFRRIRANLTSIPYLEETAARTNPPRNSITTGSEKARISSLAGTNTLSSPGCIANESPLSEIVRRDTTITIREVTQFGTISKIHIRAAKAKIATVLCWVTVMTFPRFPKKVCGAHQSTTVTIKTIGRNMQYLTLNRFISKADEVSKCTSFFNTSERTNSKCELFVQ